MSKNRRRTRSPAPAWARRWLIICAASAFMISSLAVTATPVCVTFTGQTIEDIYELDPSQKVLETVRRIAAVSGVEERSFEVWAADVGIAAAVICDGARKLYYSANTFADLAGDRSEWIISAILAHEMGHHLNGHTVAETTEFQRHELEADQFAGFVICQLGGTLEHARSGLELYAGDAHPTYPPVGVRREAVAAGWSSALEQEKCPPEARNAPPSAQLTGLQNTILINSETAAELASRPVLQAARIHFEDVVFEPEGPMILFADRITFDGRSALRGRQLTVVASEIEGGALSADGAEGENGGEILVAAVSVMGTSITARGGQGGAGANGRDGSDGQRGAKGVDGRCGPGMLGEFRGSRPGGPGTDAQDGSDGGPGADGGDGGRIALFTFSQGTLYIDVKGGSEGSGGEGGRGGRGGQGGRGGSGCAGLGGTQPTRPDGEDGLPGRDGRPGPVGNPGAEGRIWNRSFGGLADLRQAIEEAGGDLAQAVEELKRRAFSG